MTEILALIAAIYLLLQLQQLRALLSFVFAPQSARPLATVRVPEAFADLHEEAARELSALGYVGPDWFQADAPPDSGVPVLLLAAWRNASTGDTVWLSPPQSPMQPNRLVNCFVRRLDDGRYCVSQPFDAYAEICADEQMLGQTIAGQDFAAQQQLHAAWCERQGRVDLTGTDDAALHWQATELQAARVASLLRRGKLYRDRRGLLRPTLAFALKMLGALRRTPKLASQGAVPPARLAWLSEVQQRQTLRPVPRRVQAGLFALSIALFLAAGALFWNARVALILFVVIAIHELGHYLAMRAFGYRNVQMLALPLVGGVTIGHEAKPDAARRAWMSLMGPLPGILIGWLLLWFALDGSGGVAGLLAQLTLQDNLLVQAAAVFLLLNYLNVLPLPPLDGAHVVQELLPAGAPRLSAVFIAVACVIGIALSLWAGFYLLAVLALLQLPLARSRWRLGAVLQQLRKDIKISKTSSPLQRRQRVFEVFDAIQGLTTLAAPRLAQGSEAERSLAVRPMRPLQRLVVGLVYGLLLAGPVVLAVIGISFYSSGAEVSSAQAERFLTQRADWKRRAGQQELAVLATDVRNYQREWRDPAQISAPSAADPAGAPASAELPAELAAIYGLPDGPAALALLPPHQVQRAAQFNDIDLESYAIDGAIPFYVPDRPDAEVVLTPAQLRTLLVLSRADGDGELQLYDDATPPLQAGLRVYLLDYEGGGTAYADLRQRLEQLWADMGQGREARQAFDNAVLRERAALADSSLDELLAAFEKPGWALRQIAPQIAWPGPADAAQIAATAQRLGHAIPADLQALYAQHDGFPPLQLLPLAQWQPVAALDQTTQETLRRTHSNAAELPDVAACIAIGGVVVETALRYASMFWCPERPADSRLLSLGGPAPVARVEDLLREVVARQRAAENP